jgi:fatty-acyl-CoA synthase
MRGLMMDYQLTIPALMRRAETLSSQVEIVSRRQDKSIHRYRYGDMIRRAKCLAVALKDIGVGCGDRVATLAWNHHHHLESYFAIPAIGAVLHTLNVRLHPHELAYIAEHAGDRIVIADSSLLPLLDKLRARVKFDRVIVIDGHDQLRVGDMEYEELLANASVERFEYTDIDELDAAAMCYTSGTTGRPKGVVYSHRAIVLQAVDWTTADSVGIRRRDVLLAVPPMFHINGWGFPFIAALVGAKLVLPGRHLDPASLLELIETEHVTLSGGVPTIWLGVMHALDDGAHNVSSLRTLASGGSAIPVALMRAWEERYGVTMLHIWGMTEMTAVGTVSRCPPELDDAPADARYRRRAKQGTPASFVEVRARGDAGLVPWNGETMGEIEVRGPMVASAYYNNQEAADRFTDDHWLKTGDVATIDPSGCVELRDRSKDLIKTGGEWISSLALENALMGHPSVAEAAVIAVPHPRWGERPLAVVVLKPGRAASAADLREHLAPCFTKWSLPDAFEFVDEIPRTSTGKFLKAALRERYRAYRVDSP